MAADFSNSFTLSTVPIPIFPDGYQAAVTIKNTGTDTIFLGSNSTVSASNGYPLSGGSSIQWDAGHPIWLVGSSSASSAYVSSNQGSLFDAGSVAAQILAQGLAGQIADQIAIQGAPPINKSIVTDFTYQIRGFGDHPLATFHDCSIYHQMNVYVSESYTPPTLPVNPYTHNARQYTITWYDSNNEIVAVDAFASLPVYAPGNMNGITATLATFPVRGEKYTFEFGTVDSDGSTLPLLTMYVSLSMATASGITVDQGSTMAGSDPDHVSNVSGGNGLSLYHSTLSMSPTYPSVVDYPSFRSGPGTVAFHINSLDSTQTVTFNFADMISRSGFLMYTFNGPSPDAKQFFDITLPRVPLSVTATLTGGTTQVNVGFTLISQ